MITINKLSKKYGKKQILEDLDACFQAGKIYGIFGKNGAGKTTLFKCIAGLENYQGTVHSDSGNIKNHLGFLFTNPFFFPKMTGQEYIQLHLNARNINTSNIKDLNIFNLPLNQYITTYSTGMKKKLALLAILLQKNNILILDEPFNGVDIESNIIISQLLKHLKSKGKTILIASHIFATLTENCDEIYWLQNGKFNEFKKEDFYKLKNLTEDFSSYNFTKISNAF